MQVLRSFQDVPASAKHGAMTIGNFDGVHLGHQTVIAAVRRLADALPGPAVAMLFDPHPRQYFQPGTPQFTLTPQSERLTLLADLGLDFTVVLPFDAGLAALPAEAFIEVVLVAGFAVRRVVIGYDFSFGRGRSGNGELLMAAGQRHGFTVSVEAAAADGTGAYSSSRIRELLRLGNVAGAASLLGRWWRINGDVIAGAGRGAGLGFPTANITLRPGIELAHGIYASWVWIDGARHPAASYLGSRPTFDNGQPVFETFLLDYDGDLYGRSVSIDFVDFLRPDRAFPDPIALATQMHADCAEVMRRLAAVNDRRC